MQIFTEFIYSFYNTLVTSKVNYRKGSFNKKKLPLKKKFNIYPNLLQIH